MDTLKSYIKRLATIRPRHAPALSRIAVLQIHSSLLRPMHVVAMHLLLWSFVISVNFAIIPASHLLLGTNLTYSSNDEQSLSTLMATTIITGIPYLFAYLLFVRRYLKNKAITAGAIWSIVTLCFHSVIAACASVVIVFELTIGMNPAMLLSASFIFTIEIIVVVTYAFATYGRKLPRVRRAVLFFHPMLLGALVIMTFSQTFAQLGPLKQDIAMRRSMGQAAAIVADYSQRYSSIPDSAQSLSLPDGVTYKKLNSDKYKLCGTFIAGLFVTRDASTDSYDSNDTYTNRPIIRSDKRTPCMQYTSDALKYRQSGSSSQSIQYDQTGAAKS